MDENNKEMTETTKMPEVIDYYTYQGEQARSERNVKRWMIACAIIFAAFVISNGVWIVREMMYEDVVITENTQDGEGVNLMGGGDVNYGADKTGN